MSAKDKKKAQHPAYAVMVVSAIKELKNRKGCSKQAIVKYINANYNVVASNCNLHTKLAMKRLLEKSSVVPAPNSGPGLSGRFKLNAQTKVADKKEKKTTAKTTKKPPAAKQAAKKKTTVKKSPKKKPTKKVTKSPAKTKKTKKTKKQTKSPQKKSPAKKSKTCVHQKAAQRRKKAAKKQSSPKKAGQKKK